ncbi:MAG: rubrerythrin family protein [Acidobacteria bacterium]|nr:MAG: rubrerythrin family protein [Acidobacteriota bacterium]
MATGRGVRLSGPQRRAILAAQANEITECQIYRRLAARAADPGNRRVLERIAADEQRHHDTWRELTGVDLRPSRFRVALYVFLARFLGLTFALKLLERGESAATEAYRRLGPDIPQAVEMIAEENRHERELLDMLRESRLEYASSIVLGLNDALVELTGTLAGLSLAIGRPRLIALTGLVMGVAAALSMAASEFLSSREEADAGANKTPLLSALYTGAAYVATVALLTAPYFVFERTATALAAMLVAALAVIAGYTFYIATARGLSFVRRFSEMAAISLGVALISFGVGWLLRRVLGVEV